MTRLLGGDLRVALEYRQRQASWKAWAQGRITGPSSAVKPRDRAFVVVRPRGKVHVVERHRYLLDGGRRFSLRRFRLLELRRFGDADQMTVVADRR